MDTTYGLLFLGLALLALGAILPPSPKLVALIASVALFAVGFVLVALT